MSYPTVEDAQHRLDSTIVTFEGRPVWCGRFDYDAEAHKVRVGFKEFPFNSARYKYEYVDDPRFNGFQSPSLGFCNFYTAGGGGAETTYCRRLPARIRQQGLCSNNFQATSLRNDWRHTFEQVIQSEAFNEMVLGLYPSMDEVLGQLFPGSSGAVARQWAFRMGEGHLVTLYHKRESVGFLFRGELFLRPDRQYLTEAVLEEPALPNKVEIA